MVTPTARLLSELGSADAGCLALDGASTLEAEAVAAVERRPADLKIASITKVIVA